MSDKKPRTTVQTFNLMSWIMTIPLCEDPFLSMQAQNIAIVDMMVMRHIEQDIIQHFYREDRMPMDLVQLSSGLSQMWVYYLYEFLRTWRDRARSFIKAADEYAAQDTEEKKAVVLKKHVDELEERQKLSLIPFPFQVEQMRQTANPAFAASLRSYFEETEGLFRSVEALRVTLAKHEVPKTGKYRLLAEAPGYGRVNQMNGSMCWFFNLKDGTGDRVERRGLANDFLHVTDEPPLPKKEMPKAKVGRPARKSAKR